MNSNLFVISGPSGVGKDTMMALILNQIPNLNRWVTCTTRAPREGEKEAEHYFFKSKEEFKKMIDNGELVEWNKYADNYYGTPKQFAKDKLSEGSSIITAIDVNGAINVKKEFPDAHLIFIEPPSIQELNNRLLKRGTESSDVVKRRLEIAKSEIAKKGQFDFIIVNDNLDIAKQKLIDYIDSIIGYLEA